MKKRLLIAAGIALVFLAIAGAIAANRILFANNTSFSDTTKLFYVRTGTSFENLVQKLQREGIISNQRTFKWAASLKRFETVKPGKYKFAKGESNQNIINRLRSGNQEPVLVRLDGTATLADLCGKLSKQLEADSATFAATFLNPDTIAVRGFVPETFASMFIGDTYDFFWNMTATQIIERMKKEYTTYWSDDKDSLAAQLELTREQVATLASIVKGETAMKAEAPKIAGLYLNRLRNGIPLQADPTVKFALGNPNVQRILYQDLSVDSPYNTYKYSGLPPGPISLPEPEYMDAVLKHENHDYIYMCAQPGNTGFHNFAVSGEQHMQNAAAYQRWLNERNILR